jgi:hypothetical protein
MQTNFQLPQGQLVVGSAAIANGQTTSGVINTSGSNIVGLQIPAAFTGTAISFQGSLDGTLFQPIHSTVSGSALSYTVAQGQYLAITPGDLQGIPFIKLVSNASEGAARTIQYAVKG